MCCLPEKEELHQGENPIQTHRGNTNNNLVCILKVTEPFELVGMDLVGKLKSTGKGYVYICVMVDYFTKWLEVYPLRTKTAEEVSECVLDFFFLQIWCTQENPD